MITGVYLVLDPRATGGRSPLRVARDALEGGVAAIQWRQKSGSWNAAWETILAVRDSCRAAHVPFLINDRVDVALGVEADGAHVGQDDLPAGVARSLLSEGILGLSITGPEQVKAAGQTGADYLGVGPVFRTESKQDAAQPGGLDLIRQVRSSTQLPIVAIGGIDARNARSVVAAGAEAVAVISAICGAPDPMVAAQALVAAVKAGSSQ